MLFLIRRKNLLFWKEVSSCLPALKGCILQDVKSGREILFWKDHWPNGKAPMFLWLDEFLESSTINDTIYDLLHLFAESPFSELLEVSQVHNC